MVVLILMSEWSWDFSCSFTLEMGVEYFLLKTFVRGTDKLFKLLRLPYKSCVYSFCSHLRRHEIKWPLIPYKIGNKVNDVTDAKISRDISMTLQSTPHYNWQPNQVRSS